METIKKTFKINNEGREINGIVTLPMEEGNKPLVVMNHGFGGSKEEGIGFVSLADGLAENGIGSVRFDFSGCGASIVDFSEFSLKNNISDSNAVREYVMKNEEIDSNRLGILGYSMGGRLAVLVTDAETNPYQSMSLIAPGVQDFMDFENMPGFSLENGEAKMSFFGNIFHLSQEFLAEGPATNPQMRNLTKKIDSIIFSGTEDILVNPEVCKNAAEKLEATLFVLEGADHGFGFFDNHNKTYINKIVDETVTFFKNTL